MINTVIPTNNNDRTAVSTTPILTIHQINSFIIVSLLAAIKAIFS